jgi:NADPH-dependent ferric siderophore reductase
MLAMQRLACSTSAQIELEQRLDMPASPSASAEDLPATSRVPHRVRHEPRRRQLEVKRVERIAAHMIRVTLGGDLEGFVSLGFDDHVKLFFPIAASAADGEPASVSRD